MRSLASALMAVFVGLCVLPLAAQDPPTDITAQAKAAVELLVAQDNAKLFAQFTPAMQAALPDDKLRVLWTTLTAQVGAFKSVRDARMEVRGNIRVGIVTVDFERAPIDMVISFNPAGLLAGLSMRPYAPPPAPWSPPPYVDPSTYTESEVTTGAPDWPLPGTLTMPNGPGPFAAVVLVHGSGQNDRDESYGPNKTFKDLALGLASRGIAVLRYDKRGKVFGAKMLVIKNLTVKDESIDDSLAAVALLRGTARIDPARIVVIGHSLGGMLVPRIGVADPKIAGLVSMAGATRSLERAMLEQTQYLIGASGRITPEGQKQIEAMEALVKTVAAFTPADIDKTERYQGAPASYWLDLRGYDPPALAKTLKHPLLILQGERDYQVTMADDFAKWKLALDGKKSVTFHTYPALNHLFLPGAGQSLPAEYDTPGHVPVDVVSDIAAWIATLK